MRPRLFTSLSLLVLALALGACGAAGRNYGGEDINEGLYADLGGLKYQVQLSRELNPSDVEDRGYMVGLPGGGQNIGADETWFGVFMRVQYDRKSGAPLPTARDFVLQDTQGNQFRPVPLGADNLFAYRPVTLPPTKILPDPSSAAGQSTIQGSLVLFRVPVADLNNRPLVLKVADPRGSGQVANMQLDV